MSILRRPGLRSRNRSLSCTWLEKTNASRNMGDPGSSDNLSSSTESVDKLSRSSWDLILIYGCSRIVSWTINDKPCKLASRTVNFFLLYMLSLSTFYSSDPSSSLYLPPSISCISSCNGSFEVYSDENCPLDIIVDLGLLLICSSGVITRQIISKNCSCKLLSRYCSLWNLISSLITNSWPPFFLAKESKMTSFVELLSSYSSLSIMMTRGF